MTSSKEVINCLYDAALLMVGAVGISFVSKKTINRQLGVPTDFSGVAKLALVLGVSGVGVGYLKSKEYLPKEIKWEPPTT